MAFLAQVTALAPVRLRPCSGDTDTDDYSGPRLRQFSHLKAEKRAAQGSPAIDGVPRPHLDTLLGLMPDARITGTEAYAVTLFDNIGCGMTLD